MPISISRWTACVCHGLAHIVSGSIKQNETFTKIINKVKEISLKILNSRNCWDELRHLQMQDGVCPEEKRDTKLGSTVKEFDILNDIVNVMAPFEEVIKQCSADSHSTASIVTLIANSLNQSNTT